MRSFFSRQDFGRERRGAIRRPKRLTRAFIWSNRMSFSKECRVCNISVTGTRVDMIDNSVKFYMLMGHLKLYFPNDKLEIDCQVVWRSGRKIGLRLIGPYREPIRRYGA